MFRAAASAVGKALRSMTKTRTAKWEQRINDLRDAMIKAGTRPDHADAYVRLLRESMRYSQKVAEWMKEMNRDLNKLRVEWTMDGAIVGAAAAVAVMASVSQT